MSFENFKIERVPKSNLKVDNIAGTQGIHLYTYNTNNKHQWTYIFDYLDTKDKWYQFTWTNTAISLRINAQITSQHMVGVSLMRGINSSWPISAACKKRLDPVATLTHWGRVTHICVSKLTIIGSDNGLSPSRRQAIIWTNVWILSIRPSGTNFSEILIEIDVFSFKKMHLKMSSAKCRPFCLGLNELKKTALSLGLVKTQSH